MTGWNELLRDQFTWHWDHQLRPRLEGLTDAPSAAGTLDQLQSEIAIWLEGVCRLGEQGLDPPYGPAEGTFADAPALTITAAHSPTRSWPQRRNPRMTSPSP